jgi:hypothetical protein
MYICLLRIPASICLGQCSNHAHGLRHNRRQASRTSDDSPHLLHSPSLLRKDGEPSVLFKVRCLTPSPGQIPWEPKRGGRAEAPPLPPPQDGRVPIPAWTESTKRNPNPLRGCSTPPPAAMASLILGDQVYIQLPEGPRLRVVLYHSCP